jgi:hypothetical protein
MENNAVKKYHVQVLYKTEYGLGYEVLATTKEDAEAIAKYRLLDKSRDSSKYEDIRVKATEKK